MIKNINTPKVSVIVPCYNGENYINQLIESLKHQSLTQWELIIVDDHSSDNSLQICKQHADTDYRIKALKRNNPTKGACSCRNEGLSLANGEFICFIDADDLLPYHSLEDRVSFIEQHSDIDFAVFPLIGFNNHLADKDDAMFGAPFFQDDLKALIVRTLPFVVVSNIYRKTSLNRLKIQWDTNLKSLQDSDFNIQCLINGAKYLYSPSRYEYYWRCGTPGSVSKKIRTDAHVSSHLYFLSKLWGNNSIAKMYSTQIKMCDLYIYRSLLGNCSQQVLDKFVKGVCKMSSSWHAAKLKLLNALVKKRSKIHTILAYLFFPAILWRTRSEYRRWERLKREYIANHPIKEKAL